MIRKKASLFVAFLICMSIVLSVPATVSFAADETTDQTQQDSPEFTDFSELNGKKIAMLTGAPFEELIKSKVPEVGEFLYFSSQADMQLALREGKIDAFLMNNAVGEYMDNTTPDIKLFPKPLAETTFGLAFNKKSTLCSEWQKAFDSLDQDELKKDWDTWTGADESAKQIPEQTWPGKNGTVKVAACDTLPPMAYAGENGQLIGFDINTILRIAEKLDVKVEFKGMEFGAILAEVQSGKSDIACGSIVVNDERKELVDFVSYSPASFVLMVRSSSAAIKNEGFFEELKASFERTFIKDGRGFMILRGLLYTVVISLISGILGTILGFLLVFLRRKHIKFFDFLINVFLKLIAGIPVVVILMVIYYVVFASVTIPAVIVAIIGFTIIFAARICQIVWSAVQAVDIGQQEAAYALGYKDGMAFRKIILPQAKAIYVPMIQSAFVSLVKETSVAGYITVVDLTRVGDLIRSRTMEAFFPLIAISILYFLLTWLIAKAIGVINNKTTKRKPVDAKGGIKA
ncbi:MAG: ABC transporter permease subunit [Eubacterium sp.]|nr:ABC transporter permease subunit [Eubacterium sp.]